MAETAFDFEDEENPTPDEGEGDSETQVTQSQGRLPKSRIIIISSIVGVVILLAIVVLAFRMSGSPNEVIPAPNGQMTAEQKKEAEKKKKRSRRKVKYDTLFGQMDPEQTSKILKQLSFNEIMFTTEQSGQNFAILVDEEALEEARTLLAMKGLPEGKASGYDLLDNAQTLGVTEFDKRIRFVRALSGELEKAIEKLEMITEAKVQIVLPEQRLFAVAQPPVTSSILVRKSPGKEINDNAVFSIIQLVANAVENLQQENVSVIDTDGNVLSEGIFERLAAKKAGTYREEEPEKEEIEEPQAPSTGLAVGRPIVPDYKEVREWFDVKRDYEKDLEKKSMRQLRGILPMGTYKVAVSSDIGPLKSGKVVDIKRLSISIVVDNLSEDVYLDSYTKNQIFSSVAGTTGYVRGRDVITLSRADFTLLTDAEKAELEELQRDDSTRNMILGGGATLALLIALMTYLRARRKRKQSANDADILSDEDMEADEDTSETQLEKTTSRIQSMANTQPELVVKLIEQWLKPELEQQVSGVIETPNEGEEEDAEFEEEEEDLAESEELETEEVTS